MGGMLEIGYEVLLPVFLVVAIGICYVRALGAEPRHMADLLFYILVPALVIDGLASTTLSPEEMLEMIAFVVALSLIMAGTALGAARLLRLSPSSTVAFVLAVMLMNAANYGIPVNEFAFGERGVEVATIYYISSALVANTLGVYLASSGGLSPRAAMLDTIKTPIFIATVIGIILAFSDLSLPLPVGRGLNIVAEATIPIMLLLLGAQLAAIRLEGNLWPMVAGSALRLVLSPMVAVGLVMVFGFSGTRADVAIVESAMPTAVFVSVLLQKYEADQALGTGIILISTVSSLVTLSVVLSVV